MARFQTKIRKARFEYTGYSPEQMVTAATALRDSIERRILMGLDLGDAPAPPLKPSYLKYKQRRGNPIRDWKLTGRTLRSMKVLSAQVNKAIIGFTDDVANRRAYFNNLRWRQFGVSPKDQSALKRILAALGSPIKSKAA